MTTAVRLIVGLMLAAAAGRACGADAIPWNVEALGTAPQTYPAPDFHADGVKALFFAGPPYQGRPTRVFAWVGVPTVKAGEKVPGIVLVHGGGGTAFADWVRLWTGRGYAAIALDTCGSTPGPEDGKPHPRHEHGGPPGWNPFGELSRPVQDQWVYHAVADVVLAHSLLRSLPDVDPERTGLTGISWGGYLTCIVAGVDPRFKFAVPVYGCGYLGEDSAWADQIRKLDPAAGKAWNDLWEPSRYLPKAEMPMLWVTGTNDFAYPLPSLRKSYRLPRGERVLSIRIRMPHAHPPGQTPEEIHRFADSIVRGGTPLAKLGPIERSERIVEAKFESMAPVMRAEFCSTRDRGPWKDRRWDASPASLVAGKVAAEIPGDTTACYLNIIDDRGLVVSTEHIDMTADQPNAAPAGSAEQP